MLRHLLVMAIMSWLPVTVLATELQDLRRHFFDDQTDTLLVGDSEVPVVSLPSSVPLTRGAAVILYEQGNIGLTLGVAQQLSTRLNGVGWRTVLVPSMLTPQPASARLSVNSATHPKDSSMSPVIDYPASKSTLQLQLAALASYLSDTDGYRLFIAQGMTAALLLDNANSDATPAPDSMVVISPFWPERSRNQAIPARIADTTFPVLDVALDDYNNWALITRAHRQQAAHTGLKLQYRQRRMSSLGALGGENMLSGTPLTVDANTAISGFNSTSPFAARLASRVYGWITYLGW